MKCKFKGTTAESHSMRRIDREGVRQRSVEIYDEGKLFCSLNKLLVSMEEVHKLDKVDNNQDDDAHGAAAASAANDNDDVNGNGNEILMTY